MTSEFEVPHQIVAAVGHVPTQEELAPLIDAAVAARDPRLPKLLNRQIDQVQIIWQWFGTNVQALVKRRGAEILKRESTCLECKSGVCCSAIVMCTLPDVLPLARHLRATGKDTTELRARLRELAEGMVKESADDWYVRRIRCPFQDAETHLCTVYEVRPNLCRLYYSWSPVEACENGDGKNHQRCEIVNPPNGLTSVNKSFVLIQSVFGVRRERPYLHVMPRALLTALELLSCRSKDEFKSMLKTAPSITNVEIGIIAPPPPLPPDMEIAPNDDNKVDDDTSKQL